MPTIHIAPDGLGGGRGRGGELGVDTGFAPGEDIDEAEAIGAAECIGGCAVAAGAWLSGGVAAVNLSRSGSMLFPLTSTVM
jgi:hypothetical protein